MNESRDWKCVNCNSDIKSDDNFCHECGHWTSKGYMFFKNEENIEKLQKGYVYKQHRKFKKLVILMCFLIIFLAALTLIKGNDLFKPFFYLKESVVKYIYGYDGSILVTNNKYNDEIVETVDDAKELIIKDFSEQKWQCQNNSNISSLEYELENTYNIPSVNFCDMSEDEINKISNVIKKMYSLFPNIKGALTNITITNASTRSEYIAYFQPLYQFVNINSNIDYYNKVNKTQILLNSYYFMNEKMLSKSIEDVTGINWYVKDANWESTVAHEIGHYITFVILLKENNLENIILVTKENENIINNVINSFDNGEFSLKIVNEALSNYNYKYNTNLSVQEFALSISNYAGSKDEKGNLLASETIAEAIHDYYLHDNNCEKASYEIVNVIKAKL